MMTVVAAVRVWPTRDGCFENNLEAIEKWKLTIVVGRTRARARRTRGYSSYGHPLLNMEDQQVRSLFVEQRAASMPKCCGSFAERQGPALAWQM